MSAARSWPLSVRRARPADQAAVMSFATETWNGWDYMPHAWPRWLEESDGVMLVGAVGEASGGEAAHDVDGRALEPGTVVAIVRVAMPAPGEAWLEAIRVDPRVRGMDVATDLQVAELLWAAAQGATIVRYATSARNEGSHRLGARGGFEMLTSLTGTWWNAPGDGGSDHDSASGFLPEVQADARRRRRALLAALASESQIASVERTQMLWSMLSSDPSFNAAARLYEPRPWALEELTEAKFVEHVRRGEVIVRDQGELAVAILVADVPPAEDSAIRLAVVGGAPQAAFELVEEARRLAGESVRIRYADGAPLVADVEQLYRDAGYEFPEWELHILSRPIDAEHPVLAVDPTALVLDEPPEAIVVPAYG